MRNCLKKKKLLIAKTVERSLKGRAAIGSKRSFQPKPLIGPQESSNSLNAPKADA